MSTAKVKTKYGVHKKPGKTSRPTHPLLEVRSKIQQAEQLRQVRKLNQAQKICETALKEYPDYVGALHTLGLILADKGEFKQSLFVLSQAATLNPYDWMTLTALSTAYLHVGADVMAARTLEQALQRKPDDVAVLTTLGEIYLREREYERSAQAFRRVTEMESEFDQGWSGLGFALVYLGELAEATAAFEVLVKRGKHSIKTLYQLSNVPASLVSIDVLSLIDTATKSRYDSEEIFREIVEFTRGAALIRAGQHDDAWKTLKSANRACFHKLKAGYEKDKIQGDFFLERAKKTAPLSKTTRLAEDSPMSLFILGPSRSGKTTMEKLVGTLEGVKRGYENPIVENVARRTFQTAALPTKKTIIQLPPGLDDLCLEHYLEELEERAGSARAFTNTHPGRIYDAYRLAMILPNIRFIFMKRDINDISFRIFAKRYNTGNEYAYDLNAIRDYVEWYYQIIDILADRMPSLCKIVQYEDMVADPAAVLAEVAELCDLKISDTAIPTIGDDRGCAEPYRHHIEAALRKSK